MLWLTPVFLLLLGVVIIARVLRQPPPPELDDEARNRLAAILGEPPGEPDESRVSP